MRNLKINIGIKYKLMALSLASILGLAFVIVVQLYTDDQIISLEENNIKLVKLESGMLTLRRNEKDFLARKDMKYVKKFDANYSRLIKDARDLEQKFLEKNIDQKSIQAYIKALEGYQDKFKQLVELTKEIGLDPKSGFYGELRSAVHGIESRINDIENDSLMAGMLMLRRREKDFMLREDMKYVSKFNSDFEVFVEKINDTITDPSAKQEINNLAQDYSNKFTKLVQNVERRGLDSKSGVLGDMRSTIHKTEGVLTALEKQGKEAVDSEITRLEIFSISITCSLIVIVILLNRTLSASILKPIASLSEIMSRSTREKDLQLRYSGQQHDEVGQMGVAFNNMLDKFEKTISTIADTADQLSQSAEELSVITSNNQNAVSRQQHESEQVATAIEQMSATVQEVSNSAGSAAEASSNAESEAQKGKKVVDENSDGIKRLATEVENTAAAITELNEESENIGTVLNVIRDIAEQTNLLALNAAIEAARAGEQGRGFAVVADEVRTLAQRSETSTSEIDEIVKRLHNKAEAAVSAMTNGREEALHSVDRATTVHDALENISTEVSDINSRNLQIASAAEEQATVTEEINRNIMAIRDISQENSDAAVRTTDTGKELANLAENLTNMIHEFKVSGK